MSYVKRTEMSKVFEITHYGSFLGKREREGERERNIEANVFLLIHLNEFKNKLFLFIFFINF